MVPESVLISSPEKQKNILGLAINSITMKNGVLLCFKRLFKNNIPEVIIQVVMQAILPIKIQ